MNVIFLPCILYVWSTEVPVMLRGGIDGPLYMSPPPILGTGEK